MSASLTFLAALPVLNVAAWLVARVRRELIRRRQVTRIRLALHIGQTRAAA